jgi:hypothetical protein
MSSTLAATAVLISVALLVALAKRPPLPGIPYNKRNEWYFFGDIPDLLSASTPVDFFSQHVLKYGDICQVLLGPLGRLVLVSDVQ